MADSDPKNAGSERFIPHEGGHGESPSPDPFSAQGAAVRSEAQGILSSRQRKIAELVRRREARELSPFDFDLNALFQLNQQGMPLTRRELAHATGLQAVVLTPENFERIGCIDFIHSSGERMVIEAASLKPDDVFILYPEDLGNEEGRPASRP